MILCDHIRISRVVVLILFAIMVEMIYTILCHMNIVDKYFNCQPFLYIYIYMYFIHVSRYFIAYFVKQILETAMLYTYFIFMTISTQFHQNSIKYVSDYRTVISMTEDDMFNLHEYDVLSQHWREH